MARHRGLNFYRKKRKINPSIVTEILSWLFGIIAAIFIAGVMVYFLGMSIKVVGVSMEPTLMNGQQILINRFQYVLSSPKKGDVVVFLPNGNENAHYYVKRVVGAPGDKLLIQDGTLFVNGIESTFVDEKILEPGIAGGELILGAGEYFCVGDNINNSEDSRSANIGPVKSEEMIGAAWFRMKCDKGKMGLIK